MNRIQYNWYFVYCFYKNHYVDQNEMIIKCIFYKTRNFNPMEQKLARNINFQCFLLKIRLFHLQQFNTVFSQSRQKRRNILFYLCFSNSIPLANLCQ